ncbi:MAG: RHS repeat-associated core domain-containing protein [Planctomycetota bacterium]
MFPARPSNAWCYTVVATIVLLNASFVAAQPCEVFDTNNTSGSVCDYSFDQNDIANSSSIDTTDPEPPAKYSFTKSPGWETAQRVLDTLAMLKFIGAPTVNLSPVDFADWGKIFAQDYRIDNIYELPSETSADAESNAPTCSVDSQAIPVVGTFAYPTGQGGQGGAEGGKNAEVTSGQIVGTDPVNPATGEFVYRHADLTFPGFGVPFEFVRTYRSRVDYQGPLGYGWDHSYNQRLFSEERGPCAGAVRMMTGHGTTIQFERENYVETYLGFGKYSIDVTYKTPIGLHYSLHGRGSRLLHLTWMSWTLTEPQGVVRRFNNEGLLVRIEDPNHNGLTIEWEPSPRSDQWRVARVTDSVGRVIYFAYSGEGWLISVGQGTIGLSSLYAVDHKGDLVGASDARQRPETYEYDFDSIRPPTRPEYLPEMYLREACRTACAPTGTSCAAGGACDGAMTKGMKSCNDACHACVHECRVPCDDRCKHGCESECDRACRDDARAESCESQKRDICDAMWNTKGKDNCDQCGHRCDDGCVQRCKTLSICYVSGADAPLPASCKTDDFDEIVESIKMSGAAITAALTDYVECSFAGVCGLITFGFWSCGADCNFNRVKAVFADFCEGDCRECCAEGTNCAEGSCNEGRNCFDECRQGFWGDALPDFDWDAGCGAAAYAEGCLPRAKRACIDQCGKDCKNAIEPCLSPCREQCRKTCFKGCDLSSCLYYCEEIDFEEICEAGCVDGCVAKGHAADPGFASVSKYGYLRDLNHNLLRIRDGNGQVFLENVYGTDIAEPSFDAVTQQTRGDATIQLTYRDLVGEARWGVAVPMVLEAVYAVSREEFETVDICPSSCERANAVRGAEFVTWQPGILVAMRRLGESLGGFGARLEGDAVYSLNVVVITSSTTARTLANDKRNSRGSQFTLLAQGGSVTFVPTGVRGRFNLKGDPESLKYFMNIKELSVFTDSEGIFRAYPGRPLGLVHAASGRCSRPFTAERNAAGQLEISPRDACSELTVAPMATLTTDAVSPRRDQFAASALVPGRFSLQWDAVPGLPGRFDASIVNGDAPSTLARAELDAAAASPLFRMKNRPSYAFHLPGSARDALHDALALDVALPFDPSRIDGLCFRGLPPGQPRRGSGRNAPGAKPEAATIVLDPFGTRWTFYFDSKGREIRRVNHGTSAVTSLAYDTSGELGGIERPLQGRSCFQWDTSGNLIDVFQFPVPGALGSTTPIQHRYEYTSFPSRLQTVYDSRDIWKKLESFEWDAQGNLIAVIDPAGELTTFTPGAFGLPVKGKYPDGSETSWVYDEAVGRLQETVQDAMGPSPVTTRIEYDTAGRPLRFVGPLGDTLSLVWSGGNVASLTHAGEETNASATFVYDSDKQVVQTDSGLMGVSTTYDQLGFPRTKKQTAMDGSAPEAVSCFLHGVDGRPLEAVSPEGTRFRWTYDGEGRIQSILAGTWTPSVGGWDDSCVVPNGPYSSGELASFQYDLDGRILVSRGPRQEATSYSYDGFGRPINVKEPGGTTHRAGYDAMGNILWRASYAHNSTVPYREPMSGDPGLLRAVQYQYDSAGRVVRERKWHFDTSGAPVGDGFSDNTYAYGVGGSSVTRTDDIGGTTTVELDGAGRPSTWHLPTGDAVNIGYSDGGRTIRREWTAPTASGHLDETLMLTVWGAPRQSTSSSAGTAVTLREWNYDAQGRTLAIQEASGFLRTFTYDAFDRPVISTLAYSSSVTELVKLSYDRASRVVLQRSDSGSGPVDTAYEYDLLGRTKRIIRPDGTFHAYRYAAQSALVAVDHDPRGVVTNYTYTPRGQLYRTFTEVPSGLGFDRQMRSFDHDGLGRMKWARDSGTSYADTSDDIVTYFQWDSLGNKIEEHDTNLGSALTITHNYDGLGRRRSSKYGTTPVRRTFDGLDRLLRILVADAAADIRFEYSGLGGPIQRELNNGILTKYSYDAFGRLDQLKETNGQTAVAAWRWERPLDGVPRMAALVKGGAPEVASAFAVDLGGRIAREDHGLVGASVSAFELDPLTTTSDAEAAIAPIAGSGAAWRTYALDGRHNWLARKGADATLTTTPTVGSTDAYTSFLGAPVGYDAQGDLVSLGGESYAYDSWGQLVNATTAAGKRRYAYDALGRLVKETDLSTGGETLNGYDGFTRAFRKGPSGHVELTVDGEQLDEHLIQINITSGKRLYFHQDGTNSVYMVSNEMGAPAEWYSYSAFGDMTIKSPAGGVLTASAVGNRFGFQGQPFDPTTGLVQMRARFYRPAWGRFLSADPIGLLGGSNLYAFVDGAPLSWIDPLGLDGKTTPTSLNESVDLGDVGGYFDEAGRWFPYATSVRAEGLGSERAVAMADANVAIRVVDMRSSQLDVGTRQAMFRKLDQIWNRDFDLGAKFTFAYEWRPEGTFEDTKAGVARENEYVVYFVDDNSRSHLIDQIKWAEGTLWAATVSLFPFDTARDLGESLYYGKPYAWVFASDVYFETRDDRPRAMASVVSHEIGHSIGLSHNESKGIMNASYYDKWSTEEMESLRSIFGWWHRLTWSERQWQIWFGP